MYFNKKLQSKGVYFPADAERRLDGVCINKNAPCPVTERESMLDLSLIFRITAGFGTLQTQVAGLHRAVPSTTLDKV